MLLSTSELLAFERRGHTTHRAIIPAARMQALLPAIDAAWESQQTQAHRQKLRVILGEQELERLDKQIESAPPSKKLATLKRRLAQIPEGAIPFMQGFNLWRMSSAVAELAACEALASTAALLLGADRVRLYQDSLFTKRPGDGPTHWHSDLAMAPLDTNSFVTCWLPCQAVPPEAEGGSALVFASGSHRDIGLHFWSGGVQEIDASSRGYEECVPGRLEVGDATWHHGWTLHAASPNPLATPRRALAFSYFADGALRLRHRRGMRRPHTEDAESYAAWTTGEGAVAPGRPARHPLLPLVWAGGRAKAISESTVSATTTARKIVRRPRAQSGGDAASDKKEGSHKTPKRRSPGKQRRAGVAGER